MSSMLNPQPFTKRVLIPFSARSNSQSSREVRLSRVAFAREDDISMTQQVLSRFQFAPEEGRPLRMGGEVLSLVGSVCQI